MSGERHRCAFGPEYATREVSSLDLAAVYTCNLHFKDACGWLAAVETGDGGEWTAPAVQPAAPADRVLYRDNEGDLWTCDPDGLPHMLANSHESRAEGDLWLIYSYKTLGDVERAHGPLHVVPWPGEVL